ncbi:ATP-binding protein [Ancylomarina euxinus]|uniref:ATP-binding protein n=1 Tax=Ancylomarina euxinus TaxID=2283627 RepID=A0A425Y6P3_9BACT|nr:AAA family ATPase [Ancylomarina euxinus]MCZ4694116.1 AAA family ATPase [Ancylomarina euxinus]MUP15781.1 AAA family ATPase [Ancylomarina euxinus]RRG24015.1 ATP-binding protein [Ancylomarina euxinus]
MNTLLQTHCSLLKNKRSTIKRELGKEIDWSQRLIAIKGSRGVGKTTFLLDYIRENNRENDKSCLYINLNNLFFTEKGLVSFVDEFYKKGGKTLLLDQIHKYPEWAQDLRICYNNYQDLQIIFTASSILRVKTNEHLKDCVNIYYLDGLSFREFLNHEAGCDFKRYTLEEIIENHESIVEDVLKKVRPLAFFNDYLRFGYYPCYLEEKSFIDNLLKIINLMLEFDITYLNQIELKYLTKLKKLLYIIACNVPFQPNVSKLANDVETSRATIMNYLGYLKNARLIHLLNTSEEDKEKLKKPNRVYLHNTNLLYAISPDNVSENSLRETFFYNQVGVGSVLTSTDRGHFLVDQKFNFEIKGSSVAIEPKFRTEDYFVAADMIERGKGNTIPLWLFGFLY